ncbi:MAG: Phosphoenolpyruvate carboxykinase [ATP] (EC [uncultured Campylobacterales bacterium]|uniref:Phosphoenolpyruvate carboxykinase (ATP) n=1 Tax=uncultured Campylobacterales bacterium TaxID=352960 RepID=A0A6S6TJJ8_9BACT|nr:MAG: Phosphoenolpyruvate carboxykinase [ATP] (EC [uncultured Campylobacterales bacterium]
MNIKNYLNKYNINPKEIYQNLSYDELHNHEIKNNEVEISSLGAVVVDTGKFTGRSPKDKYIVQADPSSKYVFWGKVNQPISEDIFEKLFTKAQDQLNNKNLYVQDVYAGASKASRKSVRVVSEVAYHAHFVNNMFIRPSAEDLKDFTPEFTIFNASKTKNEEYKEMGLNSETFVIFNIEKNVAVIGGTAYTGEMKKGIFSIMNYLLPLEGKLPMHCSANIGEDGVTALFFGLSGTGKTTLSTDASRKLIGDDEHGWDDDGIFNFEGGCYAKCINLDAKSEPEIYAAIKRDALLENVVLDEEGNVDFNSAAKTENTRVSYPIYHIENYEKSSQGGHPKNVIFLSADAYGVLPPVSKLSPEQAMFYFLSGYTAKVAGTEIGITEPTPVFSACFGEPFLPSHPLVYADLLKEKLQKHNANVFLVNTGWSGGEYGVGKRISIKDTRTCINSILDGSINNNEFENFDVFNVSIPKNIDGINPDILNPRKTWENKEKYDTKRNQLAKMFVDNFERYGDVVEKLKTYGPQI